MTINTLARAICVAWLGLLTALLPAVAQQYPARTITIIGGYSPGSTTDLLSRTIADGLQAAWGQPVVVEARPGAGSNIAAAYVARAQPDGYTLMLATDATLISNPHLYKNMPFDPVKDFAPVTMAASNIIALAVTNNLPVTSVKDLIAYAKQNPGKLTYGSSGIASPHHLAGELLARMADINLTHIPYKGSAPAANDLIGGHISMAFLSLSSARGLHDGGKIRIIAVVENSRYSEMPDIPTIGETVPGFEMSSWMAVVAPAGTPQPIIDRLHAAIVQILKTETVRKKVGELGAEVRTSTPQDLEAVVKNGLAVRGTLVKGVGIQPE